MDTSGVIRAMEGLERKVQRAIERKALKAAGRIVLQAVRAEAPKRTGTLSRSFKLRSKKRSRKSQGVVVVSTIRHAWPQQSGWKRRRGRQVAGTDFAGRAWEKSKDAAVEAFKNAIREELGG